MKDWIENFLLNQFKGKVVVQLATIICSFVAGPVVQGFAAKYGFSLSIDPLKLQVEILALATIALEWFKARRRANPASVATQTDPALGAQPAIEAPKP